MIVIHLKLFQNWLIFFPNSKLMSHPFLDFTINYIIVIIRHYRFKVT